MKRSWYFLQSRRHATDVTVILDRSGSMEPIASDVIGGFNGFLAEQQRQPGDCCLTLIQFDDQCEVVFAARPVTQAPRLTEDTFQPRGCTALRDAIGRTIDGTGARLAALSEDERPDRVMGGHHHRRAGEREHRLHSRARDRHDLDAAGRVQLVVPVSRGESGRDRGRRKDGHRRPPECELRRNGCWSTRDVSKGVRGGVFRSNHPRGRPSVGARVGRIPVRLPGIGCRDEARRPPVVSPQLSRRLIAETAGTAFLLAAVVGSGIMADRLFAGNRGLALLANSLAMGAALVALIHRFGPISGAHFNPVVTVAERRDLPRWSIAGYIAAQLVGAMLGVWVAHAMFGEACLHGVASRAQWNCAVVQRVHRDLRPARGDHGVLAPTLGSGSLRRVHVQGRSLLVHSFDLVRQPRRDDRSSAHGHVCWHSSGRRAGSRRRADVGRIPAALAHACPGRLVI